MEDHQRRMIVRRLAEAIQSLTYEDSLMRWESAYRIRVLTLLAAAREICEAPACPCEDHRFAAAESDRGPSDASAS